MLPTIRALIFDMDGVIVNSNQMHADVWREYLAELGVEIPNLEERMIGRRNEELVVDLLARPVSPEEAFEHGARKEALYRKRMAPVLEQHLTPGLRDFLERYRSYPIGVATNAEPANLDFVLENANLRPYISASLNGHQVERPKPDPEIYCRLTGMLGIPAQECVVFEDSKTGATAARQAGCLVVGILSNSDTFPGVDFTARDFRDSALRSWLEQRLEPRLKT